MKKGLKILVIILSIAVVSALLYIGVQIYSDRVIIRLNGQSEVKIEVGTKYIELGSEAFCDGARLSVSCEGTVDENTVGTYVLTYTAQSGNKKGVIKRNVQVVDLQAPVITAPETIELWKNFPLDKAEYNLVATDNYDGDITSRVTAKYSEDKIILRAVDSSGNTTEHTITVTRKTDPIPPTLRLTGSRYNFVCFGQEYTDTGFVAEDNIDGDITSSVKIEGNVDKFTEGVYTLKYSVADSSGNTATAERIVTVYPQPSGTTKRDKVIYLTFDDGPCVYTEQILDVLRNYDVKATFFVTNQKPKYNYLLARIKNEGHTVAVHTYSHQYSIYMSEQAFFEDIDKMNDIIMQQTGTPSRFMRFPGGSSNTISKNYKDGIVTQLASTLTKSGYIYYDWNVSSRDAEGTKNSYNASFIANSTISALKSGESVVLMHDVNKANIEALPQIIAFGLSSGYTFAPLTAESDSAHHKINN